MGMGCQRITSLSEVCGCAPEVNPIGSLMTSTCRYSDIPERKLRARAKSRHPISTEGKASRNPIGKGGVL